METPKIFRDREFIRTPEDYFFCIVGELHPKDRAISYLRYSPSIKGSWSFKGQRYVRAMPTYSIPNLLRNIDNLKKKNPIYVFYSDIFSVEISAVPRNRIKEHYIPQFKMSKLSTMGSLDPLQHRAVELVRYLSNIANIAFEEFGITGSILIDLHNPSFSDIDLTVSKGENGFKLKKMLPLLYESKSEPVNCVPKPVLQKWYNEKIHTHHMYEEEVRAIEKRQWNYGAFKGTIFSIHTVRTISEITERYGNRHFHPRGIVTGTATISDISESLFNPHIYKVENFQAEEGLNPEDIREIVTYSGFYGGIYEEGEEVSAHGKLEYVEDTTKGDNYHRLIVGSPELGGHDYLKPISKS